MPNRREYDGFGGWLPTVWRADKSERLFAGFDFRCAAQSMGVTDRGAVHVGHGPGRSAAVDCSGKRQWSRCAAAVMRGSRSPRLRSASGPGATPPQPQDAHLPRRDRLAAGTHGIDGRMASGWDGTIDHTFIDSFGQHERRAAGSRRGQFCHWRDGAPLSKRGPALVMNDKTGSRRKKVSAIRRHFAAIEPRH